MFLEIHNMNNNLFYNNKELLLGFFLNSKRTFDFWDLPELLIEGVPNIINFSVFAVLSVRELILFTYGFNGASHPLFV